MSSEMTTIPAQKLTIANTPFTESQILHLLQRTPQQYIKQRPGKGGGTQLFVPGGYVKKALNYAFGWMWDFTVLSKENEFGQVVILGRLTIKNAEGQELIHKDQYGRADIKLLKSSKQPVDYGNDCKAAATDALKKCASELGIASDVYSPSLFKDVPMATITQDQPSISDIQPNIDIPSVPTEDSIVDSLLNK